jgi:PAS domain S-box-containing protein
VRGLVRRRLESSGLFEVVAEGTDGDEAVILAHRHSPALVLLDTSMPQVDGIEALPLILALCPETTVVMFTGFEEPQLAAKARELGAADLIEKSIPLEELPPRLLRILGEAPAGSVAEAQRGLRMVDDQPARRDEQEALDQHLQSFRELFDRAAIGMATMTATGTVVRANTALARLMSCSPGDLVGVDYGRLTGGQGEDLDRALELICSGGQDLASFEHPLPTWRAHTTPGAVRATLAPIRDAKGQVLYVFAQVQDVTALRASEEKLRRSQAIFRLLISAVGEYAIFMLDSHGTVLSWNAGAERIKGYTEHEIVGRPFGVFYAAEEREAGHPARNLEMALRDGLFAEEGWRVRKDGSRFWASVVIHPVYDDEGRHIGFAKVTRDQTDQRAHEEERQSSLAQQTHLLAVTAHELRNPAAVIGGSAGALRGSWDEMSDRERGTLLDAIRGSTQRLQRLANDLATASRLTTETLHIRPGELGVSEALRLAVARARMAEAGTRIDLDIQEEVEVNADAVRLGQALDNLLDNAIRHGTPPIGLSCTVEEHDVRIQVTDAGRGVDAELVPRLFERFAMSGHRGATGLGLYIVREIARKHGGDVEYHPPDGERPSTFELRLPLVSRSG